jgi:hypothetical protein
MINGAAQRRRGQLSGALVLGLLAVSGCGEKSLDEPDLPYTFKYPDEFKTGGQIRPPDPRGAFENETVIAKGDGRDLIAVRTESLGPYVAKRLRGRERSTKDITLVRATDVTVAGLDGVEFQVELLTDRGSTTATAKRTYITDGETLYRIDCQWVEDMGGVLDACDSVLESFSPS